jgi:hypothetical protein
LWPPAFSLVKGVFQIRSQEKTPATPLWKLLVRFSLLHEFKADLHYKKAIKELRTFVLDTPRNLPTFMAVWQEKVNLITRTYDLLNPTIPKEHQIRFLTDQQEAVLFITNCGKSFQPLLAAIELSSLTMVVAMKRVRQVVHVNQVLQVEKRLPGRTV